MVTDNPSAKKPVNQVRAERNFGVSQLRTAWIDWAAHNVDVVSLVEKLQRQRNHYKNIGVLEDAIRALAWPMIGDSQHWRNRTLLARKCQKALKFVPKLTSSERRKSVWFPKKPQ
jgi:hypothetical protein